MGFEVDFKCDEAMMNVLDQEGFDLFGKFFMLAFLAVRYHFDHLEFLLLRYVVNLLANKGCLS